MDPKEGKSQQHLRRSRQPRLKVLQQSRYHPPSHPLHSGPSFTDFAPSFGDHEKKLLTLKLYAKGQGLATLQWRREVQGRGGGGAPTLNEGRTSPIPDKPGKKAIRGGGQVTPGVFLTATEGRPLAPNHRAPKSGSKMTKPRVSLNSAAGNTEPSPKGKRQLHSRLPSVPSSQQIGGEGVEGMPT